MVTRLERPNVDDNAYLDAIVAERQRGRNRVYFNDIHTDWKRRVQVYLTVQGNPEHIAPWPGVAANKGKFQNLYLNRKDGSTQKPILAAIDESKLQFCPACGEDGKPNTLDHYLPKDEFPEFSITPANLFPMCDACQLHKGTATMDNSGKRYFIHPYFDDFAHQQVITVEFLPPFDRPSINVKAHADLDPDDFSLASRHLDKLQIPQRFYHFFRLEYGRLLRLVEDMRNSGAPVRAGLSMFRSHAARKAINSWDHVWYTGVLANEPLLHYLSNDDLPPYR